MSLFRVLLLAFVLVAPASSWAEEQPVDRSDPGAVAKAFLSAYQARDLVRLSMLVNETNRPLFEDLARVGNAHPMYGEIFSGWRADAAQAWDGTIGPPRYDGSDALVALGEPVGEEVMVVVLTFGSKGWAVEDINSPAASAFETLPTAR